MRRGYTTMMEGDSAAISVPRGETIAAFSRAISSTVVPSTYGEVEEEARGCRGGGKGV